ncbi:GTP-binding protein [Streptacidiphilus monticola]
MSDHAKLPLAVVAGVDAEVRRATVAELLAAHPGAVVVHHDLRDADARVVHRSLRTLDGPLAAEVDVPLTNDCPCCAARADLLPQLRQLARSGRHPLAVVELWGGSDPTPSPRSSPRARSTAANSPTTYASARSWPPWIRCGSWPICRFRKTCATTACTPVRTTTAPSRTRWHIRSSMPTTSWSPGPARGGATEERERRLAGVAMVHQLHPTARRLALGTGALAAITDCRFDITAARDRVNPALAQLPQAAEHSGVSTLVWERRRPLHPQRFHAALEELVPAAHRSRGRFWLANRPDTMLAWDAAGAGLVVEDCGPWLAALNDEQWEQYPAQRRAAAALDWHPVHGDRVQQLVFTAAGLDREGIVELLDSCLLTDEELVAGESGWKLLPDAFRDLLDPVA